MRVVVLYRSNSEHERAVLEFEHEYTRRTSRTLQLSDINTRDGASMATLYDITMWTALLYIWWLDRSVDPRDKQDPLMYWLFIGLSLVPWTAKGDEEPLIKAVALLMLFAAFYRATTLRQKTSCYQAG